ILDVHVIRAGRLMRLYSETDRVEKNYIEMEQKFVRLAKAMVLPTADLDSLIWSMMRSTPRLIGRVLSQLPPKRAKPDANPLKGSFSINDSAASPPVEPKMRNASRCDAATKDAWPRRTPASLSRSDRK